MILTPLPIERLDITQTMGAADKSPRSAGIHVSALIRDILEKTRQSKAVDGWALENSGQVGFLWEDIFSEAMTRMHGHQSYMRMGELELDGIYGTPDLLNVEEWAITELKCRWKHVRHWDSLEDSFRDVLWQIKAYCKMAGTRRAELHMLFIVGDWRGSGPLVRGCKMEFDQRELDENWTMLKNHARSIASAQRS